MSDFNYFNEQEMQCRELSEEIAIEISFLADSCDEADLIWHDGLPTEDESRLVARAFARTEEDELFWGALTFNR